jgi:hypothetical protein
MEVALRGCHQRWNFFVETSLDPASWEIAPQPIPSVVEHDDPNKEIPENGLALVSGGASGTRRKRRSRICLAHVGDTVERVSIRRHSLCQAGGRGVLLGPEDPSPLRHKGAF